VFYGHIFGGRLMAELRPELLDLGYQVGNRITSSGEQR
jgi:hypothetical protein